VKDNYYVGDLVEVRLNTSEPTFTGRIVAMSGTIDPNNHTWYKIKPTKSDSMPGIFWYKDDKIVKIAKEESIG
tara:strand:- start:479 stop:697 length:219 start_codon:yes stop_codon:yes gene_type:complete